MEFEKEILVKGLRGLTTIQISPIPVLSCYRSINVILFFKGSDQLTSIDGINQKSCEGYRPEKMIGFPQIKSDRNKKKNDQKNRNLKCL